MDGIVKRTGCLCIVGYIMGLVMNMAPMNSLQKSIRLAGALYIITAVFVPLSDIQFDFSIPDRQRDSVRQSRYSYIVDRTREEIEFRVCVRLDEKNISYESVRVHIHEQSDKIYLQSVNIAGVPEADRSRVVSALEEIAEKEKIVFGD